MMADVDALPLDPISLPLTHERLIEASAGTGKTFTIVALYLRLLLGLGGKAAYLRPLSVEELLVVTFTEAATEELRGRVRASIHELRIACVRNATKDPLLQRLLEQIQDRAQAAEILRLAGQQMDEAAIFTIHGFCQRMLSLNAFESGMLFEQQLVEDESSIRRHACADFWRRYCYPLTGSLAAVVSEQWSGPDALLREIKSWLQGDPPILKQPPAGDETLLSRHNKNIAAIDEVKNQWRQAAADIPGIIARSDVSRPSYNSKNLPNWLAKIDHWAKSTTTSYTIPDCLWRFSQTMLIEKSPKGEPPRHPVFDAITRLRAMPLTIRDVMITHAVLEIRKQIEQEKQRRAEFGFDDMLSRLDTALNQDPEGALACAIRARFPVALIDEFQDTDPQQYRIFHRIYSHQPTTALLLIGDPKQAIYGFRGADIFTYIKARDEVDSRYTLDTNWRSSPAMVESVNLLFGRVDNPFLFSQIPFLPVKSATKNNGLRFTLYGEVQPAMSLWLQPGEGCAVQAYQQAMARQCAQQIRNWLAAGQGNQALLWRGEEARAVQASDIRVLVRSHTEASLISEALAELNIPSIYLSNRDSVFATLEAREILWILQAVLTPDVENVLRSAIASSMLGLQAGDIETLNLHEQAWDQLVEEFIAYRTVWLKHGVMPMLRSMMARRQVAENLLATPGGERRLTDLLHLSELLQQTAGQSDSPHALIRWLGQQITEPNGNVSGQQLRLESDKHLVQIVTIHKAKGLEYSLVWLPFIANYRKQSHSLYHDRTTFAALLDLNEDSESQQLVEEERLAEDLRLLYVALTRSIWHCSLGVAPLFHGPRAKKGASDLHHGALGYLLQQKRPLDATQLKQCLSAFAQGPIKLEMLTARDPQPWSPLIPAPQPLSARVLHRYPADGWHVTSYSGLQQHGTALTRELVPKLDMDAVGERVMYPEQLLTPYTFPRGATAGIFLHNLFEQLDFSQPLDEKWLAQQLQTEGLDVRWVPVLMNWLQCVLHTPLTDTGVTLNQLTAKDKLVEMEFYLPISQPLQAAQLDKLMRDFDPLSANCPTVNFKQVRGMLKGFIDLVFHWQGRYYLLDYKSNWLGAASSDYHPLAMARAMQAHRYDLQYQLYTLALHRYLRHRVADYRYKDHFGGVIYLFLRGIEANSSQQGIFFTRPDEQLVFGMDKLFATHQQESVI